MDETAKKKGLYKSTEYKMFTGVAAGIADYIDTNHGSVRILFILLTLAGGIGLALYITLSVILPTEVEMAEKEDREFYYHMTHDSIKPHHSTFLNKYSLLSTTNIVALGLIFLGILSLYLRIVPWELIPVMWRYPSLIIIISFGFIIKSITHKK